MKKILKVVYIILLYISIIFLIDDFTTENLEYNLSKFIIRLIIKLIIILLKYLKKSKRTP